MSARDEFNTGDRNAWVDECKRRGLEGPYTLYGSPRQEQFVRPGEGTAALWNVDASRGVVFADREPVLPLTSPTLEAERAKIAALTEVVLESKLGYRCAFAVVYVRADTAPAVAGYATNVSRADAISLLQGMIDDLEKLT